MAGRAAAVNDSTRCVTASAPECDGQPGRAQMGELRVADGGVRDQVRAGDADLHLDLGVGQHGDRRHLRAGARGRRNCGDRHDRALHDRLAVVVLGAGHRGSAAARRPWPCRGSFRRPSRRPRRRRRPARPWTQPTTPSTGSSACVSPNTWTRTPADLISSTISASSGLAARRGSVQTSAVRPRPATASATACRCPGPNSTVRGSRRTPSVPRAVPSCESVNGAHGGSFRTVRPRRCQYGGGDAARGGLPDGVPAGGELQRPARRTAPGWPRGRCPCRRCRTRCRGRPRRGPPAARW